MARRRRGKRKRMNQGGLAVGPKHSQGGIPGIIKPTGEPIEFEGGEYIMRASSVQKYGEGAMARINQGLADTSAVKSLKKGGRVRPRRKLQSGGGMSSRRNSSCPDGWEHLMPSGNWMCGRTHGSSGYKRGGKTMPRRMKRGGRARTRKMQNGGRALTVEQAATPPVYNSVTGQYGRGGRVKRFQTGGHTHDIQAHSHKMYVDRHGRLGPQVAAAQNETIPDNWANSTFGYGMNTGVSRPRSGPPWGVAQINPDPLDYNPGYDYLSGAAPYDATNEGPHAHRSPHRQMRKRGGRVRQNRKRMRKGGMPRMQMGGRTDCPPGQYRQGGQCVSSGGYKRGGRVRRARRR